MKAIQETRSSNKKVAGNQSRTKAASKSASGNTRPATANRGAASKKGVASKKGAGSNRGSTGRPLTANRSAASKKGSSSNRGSSATKKQSPLKVDDLRLSSRPGAGRGSNNAGRLARANTGRLSSNDRHHHSIMNRDGNKGKHNHNKNHRHGHRRDRDRSSFYLGFGVPFGTFSPWYNPLWNRPWNHPWSRPYYSGVGYSSSRFGFSYGVGYSGYSQAWPYYDYDPYCDPIIVSNPVYVVDQSPQIVSVPPTVIDNGSLAFVDPADPLIENQAPVQTPVDTPPAPPIPQDYEVDESADEFIRLGEEEFYNGQYDRAIKAMRHALLEDPRNGVVILMLAQALFETDNYAEAAGAVQQGLSLLPEDKWGIVVENYKDLYSNTKDYVEQLKALELAVKKEPESPALRFLVAYHYGFLGYSDHAARELDKLLKLAPKDLVGKKLQDLMNKRIEEKKKPSTPSTGTVTSPPTEGQGSGL